MIITCDMRTINNPLCKGTCYCHHMHMIHGNDPNRCAECGCPKTLKAFNEDYEKENKSSGS